MRGAATVFSRCHNHHERTHHRQNSERDEDEEDGPWAGGYALRNLKTAEPPCRSTLCTSSSVKPRIWPSDRFDVSCRLIRCKAGDIPDFDHKALNELTKDKKDVPTMGGILILIGIVSSVLLLANLRVFYIYMAFVCLLWLGALGFADDWIKLRDKSKSGSRDGLKFYQKLLFQIGLGVLLGVFIYMRGEQTFAEFDVQHFRIFTFPFFKGEHEYGFLLPPGRDGRSWLLIKEVSFSTRLGSVPGLPALKEIREAVARTQSTSQKFELERIAALGNPIYKLPFDGVLENNPSRSDHGRDDEPNHGSGKRGPRVRECVRESRHGGSGIEAGRGAPSLRFEGAAAAFSAQSESGDPAFHEWRPQPDGTV
jgi:hypothetical protein